MRYDEEARTGMAFIAKPDENTAEFVFYRNPGADMRLRTEELDRDLLQQSRAFHFGSLSLGQEPSRGATLEAAKIAREAGALISFDVNYRPTLWSSPEQAYEQVMETIPHVNLLKVNEVELSLLAGSDDLDSASKTLLDMGPDLCVVTLGPDGSYFRVTDGSQYVRPFKVQAVDAVGCGDAFVAGLLCQLVIDAGWRAQLTVARMREILRYANAVGALTALKQGVIPSLPTAAMVDEFVRKQN
jgi:fructokinase